MATTDAGLSSLSLATYSTSTYYSTYFNGSSDYLTVPDNAALQLTGAFTIEAWVYFVTNPTTQQVWVSRGASAAAGTWSIGTVGSSSSIVRFYYDAAGGQTFNTSLNINTWYHIALVRDGSNVVSCFINGVKETTTVTVATSFNVATTTNIGVSRGLTSPWFNGYLSNLRILKGTALYTANFNAPTAQLTAIANTALLTCNTNNYTDGSVNNFTITKVGTGFKQFTPTLQVTASATLTPTFATGTLTYNISVPGNINAISVTPTANDTTYSSIKFNGNVSLTSGQANIAVSGPYFTNGYSAYFTAGLFQYANSLQINTQGYSWTAEMWVYPTGTYTANNTLFAKRTNGSTVTAYEGYLTSTNGYLGFFNGTAYTSTYALPSGTWSHVVYTYDGSQVSIYVNGNKIYGIVATISDVAATPLTIGGKLGYTEMMIGNISNFRFIKGYSVYTQNFTPPAQPVSITQNSSSGIQAIASAPTNGYSGYFNGTNSYLSLSDNAAFQFGTSNFTMEAWVYPLLVNSVQRRVWSYQVIGSSATVAWFGLSTTNKFTAELRDSGGTNDVQIFGTSTPVANTWYHVAFTRVGTTTYLYVNGILETTTTGQSQNISSGGTPAIGSSSSADYFNGYITNVRIIKGNALYSLTNFAPSSIPLTPIANTSLLALQNSLTTDASTNNFTLTNNNVTLSTAFSPFSTVVGTVQPNGSSVYFNGSTSLSNSSVDFTVSGDFTIECWIYPTVTSECDIFKIGSEATGRIVFGIGLPSAGNLFYNIYGSSSVTLSTGIGVNTWHHVAFVRRGTTITGYVNGVSGSTPQTLIGTLGNTSGFSTMTTGTGYITNLRYVIGTALYTANFNVYNAPLVAITNTKLLLLQSSVTTDASTNNYTITPTSPAPTLSTTITPFIINGASSTQFLSTALAYQQVSNSFVPALSLGQGHNNFTAEAWVYLTATPPAAPGWYIIQKGTGSTPGLEWSFSVTSTGLYFQTASGIPTGTTTSTAFGANTIPGQWMHLALTKVGTSVNIWFNGFYTGTVNGVNNLYYNTNVASYITIANTQTGATTAFSGYISNARVVYGKAIYTVNYDVGFTPNTTTLSLTQGTTSTTASIDNANLYTVINGNSVFFNNTNDFLTFPEPTNYFYSAQFNGTSQYLTMPSNTVGAQMGSSDFTIECWVYPTASTSPGRIINNWSSSTQQSASWEILQAGGGIQFNCSTAGTTSQVSLNGGGLIINGWNHIAGVRIGNVFTLYMNGVSMQSTTQSITLQTADTLTIGARNNLGSYVEYFAGYSSNVRIIKGTGIYTTGFTPSTAPLTKTSQGATASQVSLLTLQNYTIVDNSPSALTITNTGTVTTSQIQPFTYSPNDVTVEAWIMLGAAPTTRGWLFNNSVASGVGDIGLAVDATRALTFWSDSYSSSVLTSATLIPLYTWTHVAVVFSNNTVYLYINGVRDTNSYTKTTVWIGTTPSTIYIGRYNAAASQYFPGYITNLRMVYGAVYTSKFTVPTSPLTAVNNTVFLGLQSSVTTDASINNATITKGSGATGLIVSPLTSPFTTYLPSVTNGNSVALGWGIAVNSATTGVYYSSGLITAGQLPGDFTMECWLYLSVLPSGVAALFDNRAALTDAGYVWYINTNGTFAFFGNNAAVVTSTTVLAINTWYHLAITRQNGTMKTWINGIQDSSASNTTDYGRTTGNFYLNNAIAPGLVTGYVSNLRFIQGTAIYTGTFTPSITPYTLTTSSSTNVTAVNGVTTYPSVGNPNGVNYSGSYYFGGTSTSQNISIPNAGNVGRFELSTYDFTIEAWFYCTGSTSQYTIVSAANNNSTTDYAWNFYLSRSTLIAGTLNFISYAYFANANGVSITTPSLTIVSNQWYHAAVVRTGQIYTIYLNGVNVFTSSIYSNPGTYQLLGAASAATIAIGAQYATSPYVNNFFGYISNVRVIKGYAIYTGAFNLPTGPVTNIQSVGTNISAITGTSTSLLALQNATTTDGSNNNFTLTATGSPTISSTIVPNIQTQAGQYSTYFNGTSCLTVFAGASGGINQLTTGSSGDYTVECWVYMTSMPSGNDYGSCYTILGSGVAANNGIYYMISITNNGYLFIGRGGGGYVNVTNPIPSVSTWTHLAFVNAGTTMNIYMNGVKLSNTASLTGTGPAGGTTTIIGHTGWSAVTTPNNGQFIGYITNLRAVAGVQVYTGTFTVPTGPLTLTQSSGTNISAITAGQTKLLMLQNTNYITDTSTNAYIFALTGTITTSTSVPFVTSNGNSVQFTGSSQYITAPSDSSFAFGTGNFTIEAWVYLSSGTTGTIFDSRTGSSTVHPVLYITSSSIRYATSGTDRIIGSTLSTTTWYHIALVRISNITKLYVNGVQSGSSYADINNYLIGSPLIGTGYNSANPLVGYISNLRVVKGTGVYTNGFVVPTTALTNTQSATGNIVTTGIGSIPVLGNSVYFNGSTDYMKAPSNITAMGTGDFTIETYYYPTSFASVTTLFGQYTAATTGLGYWNVQVTTAGIITVYYNGSTNFAATTAILVNEWYHIALVRINGTITLYVNGTSYGTVSFATQFGSTSIVSPLYIGATQLSGPTQYAAGYMSNLRIVKGLGVYSISSITNSVSFSGTSQYITTPTNSGFTFGTGDFTVEMWFYKTGSNLQQCLVGGTGNLPEFEFDASASVSKVRLFDGVLGGGNGLYGSTTINSNQWYHVAWVKIGSTYTVYLNGTSEASGTSTVNYTSTQFRIGARLDGTTAFTGYISNLRIVKGTGVYTGNFAVPTVPLTATQSSGTNIAAISAGVAGTSGTQLLALQTGVTNDTSVNGLTLTATGTPPLSTTNPFGTTGFTVPTSPLSATQSSGTNIAAITGTSTSLLLFQNSPFADNSTFSNTITPFGNPQYSPVFSPSYFTYPTPAYANSCYFNGSTTVTNLLQPAASSGDFTIELWVYPTVLNATNYLLSTLTATTNCFHLWITSSGTISLAVDSATASITSATPSLAKTYTWTHIAITRVSGTIYMYVNGFRQATTLSKATQFGEGSANNMNFGRYLPTPGQYYTGYMTNVRFVYGTAVYIGSYFTPPYTTPLTAITNTVLLLMQTTTTKDNSVTNASLLSTTILSTYTNPYTMMQLPVLLTGQNSRDVTSTTGFRDNSMYNATLTSGSLSYASHQPTISPFGVTPTLLIGQSSLTGDNSINNYSGSLTNSPYLMPYVTPFSGSAIAFNGSTQYITGTSLYNSLGGDFTIEFFMMAGPQTASGLIMGRNIAWANAINNNWYIACGSPNSSGKNTRQTIQLWNYQTFTVSPVYVGTIPVCDSKWHHIAIVRISNIVTVYVDGVKDTGTLNTSNGFYNANTWDYSSYTIGSSATDGTLTVAQLAYNGMLSNLRIINGTGIYTGVFTPPTNTLTKSQTSGTNIAQYTPSTPGTFGNSLQFKSTTGAYIVLSPGVGTSFYNNDYTVEFWYYLSGRVAGASIPCFFSNNNQGTVGALSMYAGHNSSDITKYQLAFSNFSFPYMALVSNTNIIYGKWTHIAVVRRSGIVYLYINGILDSSTNLGNYAVYSANWYIGTAGEGDSQHLNGFISNFRAVNGVAVYTGNFTVPTTALTSTQSSGTNISAISNSIVANGAAIQTYSAYQSWQLYYGFPLHFNTGANDWTVEGWVLLNTLPTTDSWASGAMTFFGSDSQVATDGIHCVIGQTQLFLVIGNIKYGTVTHGMSLYTWYHLAYVRYNNIVYFYVNGTLMGSTFGLSIPGPGTHTVTYIGGAANTSIYSLNGFISNLRFVKGLAVYQNAFLPSTILSASQNSTTNINAITGTSTSALVLQNSTTIDVSLNNFTLTVSGTPSISSAVVPYFPIVNGYSVFFNGGSSNDKLTIAATSAFDFSTGYFTIEFWMYPITMPTVGNACRVLMFGTNGTGNSYNVSFNNDGSILAIVPLGSPAGLISAAGVISANNWYHVAVSCNAGVATLYINGVSVAGPTYILLPTSGAITLNIGYDTVGTVNFQYRGYLSNLRIVKGIGVYTGAFTVPTTALTLTQSGGTNISPITLTLPTSNSMLFNAANTQYLNIPNNSKLQLVTSTTVEMWIYPTSVTGQQGLIGYNNIISSVGTGGWMLGMSGTTLTFNTYSGGISAQTALSGGTLIINAWQHVAFTYNGTNINLFVNGSSVTTGAMGGVSYTGASLSIGKWNYTIPRYYTGYMSNIRIVNSLLYTGTFTPSTIPLTTIANTVLLIQPAGTIVDLGPNALSVNNNGSVSVNTTVTPFLSGASPYGITFNGTNQYLTVANSFMNGITGTYTIEGWFNFTSVPSGNAYNTAYGILSSYISTQQWHSWSVGISSGNYAAVILNRDGSSFPTITTSITFQTGVWVHIAFVNDTNNLVTMYINGAVAGSVATSGTWSTAATGTYIGTYASTTGWFKGTMNSLRVTNTAVYSGAFTPSYVLPLTAITGTVFLTAQNATIIDNSTNNYTITNVNTATTGTITLFAPATQLLMLQSNITTDTSINNFAVTTTGAPSLNITNMTYMPFVYNNGYSVYFNGPNNYITIPSDSSFTFSTGDFTIEGWIYISAGTTGTLFDSRTGSSTVHPVLYVSGTVRYSVAGTDRIIGSTLSTSTWYHIAVSRISGSTKLFVNGVQSGSTYSDSNDYLIGAPTVGTGYGYNAPLVGYISNLRVVNGTGVYISKFTTPTIPLSITQSAITNIQSIAAKVASLGNAGYAPGGVQAYVAASNPVSKLGFQFPGNFTIEAWVNAYSLTTAYKAWFDTRSSASDTSGICVGLTNNTGQWGAFSANGTNYVVSSISLSVNTWYHTAVVRIGTTMTLYLNGANVGSATISNNLSTGNAYVGSQNDYNYGWLGYISNLRVVKGVGVYTGAFTPSTSPLSLYQPSGTNIVGSTQPAAPTNGSSILFNGSTDYLSASSISAYQFFGDFSIECWFYTTTISTSQMIMSKVSNKSAYDWYLKINAYNGAGDPNAGQLEFSQRSPSVLLQSPIVISGSDGRTQMGGIYANTWNHVVIVRTGSNYYMIINGNYFNAPTTNVVAYGAPAYDATNNLNIGVNGVDYTSNFFNGYITNVRIINGAYAYNPSVIFSPMFAPLATTQVAGFFSSNTAGSSSVQAITSSQTVFLGLQSTLTGDNSTNNNSLTAYGTPSVSTTVHPFVLPLNGYSASFSSGYLTSSNTASEFVTNTAWTMEAWFYTTSLSTTQTVIETSTNTTNMVSIRIATSGAAVYYLNTGNQISGGTVTTYTWNHVALVKNGSTTTLYLNGSSVGTTSTAPTTGLARFMAVGCNVINGNLNYFSGYISNVRVVKDVAVYTGTFTVPTSPLTLTQSSGTNISAITGSSTYGLILSKDYTDSAGTWTMTQAGTIPMVSNYPFSPFLTTANYIPSLLAMQSMYTTDNSPSHFLMSVTGNQAGNAYWVDYTYTPFGNITALLTAQSITNGIDASVQNRVPYTVSGTIPTRVITPSGAQTPTALLTAQSITNGIDASSDNLGSTISVPASASVNTIFGPFNNDIPILALQGSTITDNSNNRAQLTVVGAGISPTDSSPFGSKSLTSLLIPYGYNDISINNTTTQYIANNANVAQLNYVYNPFTIPSTTVSALLLQTSNVLLDSSINNVALITNGTAPTSNVTSPFGTYYANGILTLNTSTTTGLYSNIVNYANILVTANDTVTTNAYSITITSLQPTATPNLRSVDGGITSTTATGLTTPGVGSISIVDVANSQQAESLSNANILTSNYAISYDSTTSFAGYGLPNVGNVTITIADVANSNLAESLINANIPSTSYFKSYDSLISLAGSGQPNVGPAGTFAIVDVANSAYNETLFSYNLGTPNYYRSSTEVSAPGGVGGSVPTPVGGVTLLITYSYTDGVVITAANVQSGSGSGSFASNTQVWYQT